MVATRRSASQCRGYVRNKLLEVICTTILGTKLVCHSSYRLHRKSTFAKYLLLNIPLLLARPCLTGSTGWDSSAAASYPTPQDMCKKSTVYDRCVSNTCAALSLCYWWIAGPLHPPARATMPTTKGAQLHRAPIIYKEM